MMTLLIKHGHIITADACIDDAWLLCADGKIQAIGQGDAPSANTIIDAGGDYVLAGFIDVHVHGSVGADVMDASVEGLLKMSHFFAANGVTSFLPTTLTASSEETTAALQTIREAMSHPEQAAKIIGAHLEGPYLHIAQSGAQNKQYIRPIDRDEMRSWLDLEVIKLVSVAPELDDSDWLIAECLRRGVTVSAAHTTATYDEAQVAIAAGLSHATHTYNAMPKLHHRDPGALAALMLAPTVNCELIADTIHVHPAMMHLLHQAIGTERLLLITDAMQAAGVSDGVYELGRYQVTVKNGEARLADGTLAGSTLTMNRALANFLDATQQVICDCWQVSSQNAARAIAMDDRIGCLSVGYDADIVILDADDIATVQVTLSGGQVIYERDA